MALKMSVVFVICVLFAASMAEAQLGEIISHLLGLIRVQGTVFCTANGRVNSTSASTPVFSNALVQLQCNGNVVSSTTTNNAGVFSMLLDPVQLVLSSLQSQCKLVVTTPLSTCNATLPSDGVLISLLQTLGTIVSGLLNITTLGPSGFNFLQTINN
ncbi:phylloplanin-like [Humulus lupulus]|uniref:phylloplanin-like n=1 Tax=Humulus lupulus TaxID=3486 RepID=UPI002B417AB2|nr:phylloplanin-like [Humulus lupulus]